MTNEHEQTLPRSWIEWHVIVEMAKHLRKQAICAHTSLSQMHLQSIDPT